METITEVTITRQPRHTGIYAQCMIHVSVVIVNLPTKETSEYLYSLGKSALMDAGKALSLCRLEVGPNNRAAAPR